MIRLSFPRFIVATALCLITAIAADVAALRGASQTPDAPPTSVEFETRQLTDQFWGEGAAAADVNRDGRIDIISGPFWYAGPDFASRHEYYPATASFERTRDDGSVVTIPGFEGALGTTNAYSDNFLVFPYDFNADSWPDILIAPHPGEPAYWYENPRGGDQHWPRHMLLDEAGNESPAFVDITGDGRPELVCNADGFFGYAEQTSSDPTEPWTFRPITPQGEWQRYTHGLGVGDVNGDGLADLVEADGWWEQPVPATSGGGLQASLGLRSGQAGGTAPVWTLHPADFGDGAQFHVYDVNDDGLADVVGSLDAHGYGLAWHEQVRDGDTITFTRHLIMGSTPGETASGVSFSQLHAVELVDIDGDGLRDIVTGKRFWAHGSDGDVEPNAPAVVYWFQLVRNDDGVEFVPHLIDDDSGVGTQVTVANVGGDGRPDVIVGNKKGTFVSIQQPRPTQARAAPALTRDAPAFIGLRPAEAVNAMTLPPGFHADVFAGEPDVRQPIAFAIDDRGRLWVAEAYAYPVRQPEGEGKDRVLVFEDVDGDGQFDKRTVFVDNLNLVSGIEVGFGGLWVGAAPYLMFIPIADGDDPRPAGPPRILLDGWGYEDTHETLNSFMWGPDGWLYGAHGVFTHSNVGAPGTAPDERSRINAGIWRYHPTRHQFEVFAEGLSNPWGVDFNDHGHAVAVACVIPHLWHVVQGAHYERQAGQHFNPNIYDDIDTIGDHLHYVGQSPWAGNSVSASVGGGHAHAGLMVYLGGSWPDRYRGQTFMNNIHGARINVDAIEPAGSGYVGHHEADFLTFNDPASQVVNLQYDQDGSVYLIDWYDQEQCHINDPEIPDRGNGRIYKVSYGNSAATRVDMRAASDDELIGSLLRENDWHVRHARRVLQERAAAGTLASFTIPRLRAALGLDGSAPVPIEVQASGYLDQSDTPARLRLLWALHVVSGLTPSDHVALMRDEDEHMRAWAVQLAAEGSATRTQEPGEPAYTKEPATMKEPGDFSPRDAAMAELARRETSPTVLLYLASAVQRLPIDARWPIVEALHAKPVDGDHNLPLMIWYATEPLVEQDEARALTLALSSSAPRALEFTARRVASIASDESIDLLVATLRDNANDDERALAILRGTNAAFTGQKYGRLPEGWDAVERMLGASANARVRTEVQALALTFGSAPARAEARRTLGDGGMSADTRLRAMHALVNVRDEALPPLLLGVLDDERLRAPAIRALASFSDPATPGRLLGVYGSLPAPEQRDVLVTLASRPTFARVLVDAMAAGRVPVSDITAEIARQLRLLDDPDVTASLETIWGVARSGRAGAAADIARYTTIIDNDDLPPPSASAGRQVFARTCAACHRLFGEGGTIGPDITGSNRADLGYLLHNILDPNAEIPNAYRTTTVELADGRVIGGIVEGVEGTGARGLQTPGDSPGTTVTVQTLNERITLSRSEVRTITPSDISMMPEGLLQQLDDSDVRDLVAYLRSPRQVR